MGPNRLQARGGVSSSSQEGPSSNFWQGTQQNRHFWASVKSPFSKVWLALSCDQDANFASSSTLVHSLLGVEKSESLNSSSSLSAKVGPSSLRQAQWTKTRRCLRWRITKDAHHLRKASAGDRVSRASLLPSDPKICCVKQGFAAFKVLQVKISVAIKPRSKVWMPPRSAAQF